MKKVREWRIDRRARMGDAIPKALTPEWTKNYYQRKALRSRCALYGIGTTGTAVLRL